MKKFLKSMITKVSGRVLLSIGAMMLFIGSTATNLCVVPWWHSEPEMPQSMLDEIQ